jgi:hypothetical protein
LAALPLFTSAQNSAGLKLGLKLIPQSTWLFNQQDSDAGPELDYNSTFSLAFGGSVDYFVAPVFGIGLEFLISSQGQKYDSFDSLFFHRKLSYLKVPLMLSIASNGDGAGNFLAQIGPQASFLLNSSLEDGAGAVLPDSTAYSSVTMGVALFVGFTINVGVGSIVTGIRLDRGLSDAEDKSAGGFPAGRGAVSATTGGLVLGFRLGIGD